MKKQFTSKHPLIVGVLLAGLMMIDLAAREVRNPLPLWWGYWHYPVPRPKDFKTCWNVDAWGAGYYRSANRIFENKETFNTDDLSALFFCEDEFLGINAFVPGSLDPLNPFLSFSLISPRVSYNERGAFFGLTVDRTFGCECEWRGGVRVTMPFRDISTDLESCCDDFEEGNLEQVRRLHREQVLDDSNNFEVINQAFAYRLDFLSSLVLTVNAPQKRLVIYNDLAFTSPAHTGNISIDGKDVTTFNDSPVHVIARDDGTVPPAPFTLRFDSAAPNVTSLPILANNGSGLGNNQRAQFGDIVNNGSNYAPLGASLANQRRLWVVPTAETDTSFNVSDVADNIRTTVENIIASLDNTSALAFFIQNGFIFENQRAIGVGDMNVEFFAHRDWCNYFGELLLGFRFPTGKRFNNPKDVFRLPLGDNGHTQIYGGVIGGWEGLDWLHIKADGRYYYAIPRHESIAATFAGATVKGLGPTVDSTISWQWFVGDLDFTFLPSCNPRAGIDVGYQIYVKDRDKVRFQFNTAIDLLDVANTLSPNVAECRTNVTAHRIKAEIFQQTDNAEIFGGWMHTFAGRNAMKDTDLYLGLIIYF